MEGDGTSKVAKAVIQNLRSRGWCIEDDNNQLKALITIQTALADDTNDTSLIANSVELELLNMDLNSIGAKSLPDPNILRNKTSHHLQGPKILQISSVRDISVSSIEGVSDSANRRLLRFTLTDGCNEITAIEYSHIPSIPSDVVPGTKVRLENKVTIQGGILCLNSKVITLLGGVVQSLYEEWQMKQKYLSLSRSSIRMSQETESAGPPQFEKLQIEAPSRRSSQHPDYFASTSNSSVHTAANTQFRLHDTQQRRTNTDDRERKEFLKERNVEGSRRMEVAQSVPVCNQATAQKHSQNMSHPNQYARGQKYWGKDKQEEPQVLTLDNRIDCSESTSKSSALAGNTESRPIDTRHNADDLDDKVTTTCLSDEQKTSNTDMRLKEVAESVPVQNQAAAQKLLRKMIIPNQAGRHSRGRKHKGKNKQEELPVFTLDEWEKRKAGAKPPMRNNLPDTSSDEDLAWQLQNQLDMEDSHDVRGQMEMHNKVTDDIRANMFNYERDVRGTERGGTWGRGRGRGTGRGRGRGRF